MQINNFSVWKKLDIPVVKQEKISELLEAYGIIHSDYFINNLVENNPSQKQGLIKISYEQLGLDFQKETIKTLFEIADKSGLKKCSYATAVFLAINIAIENFGKVEKKSNKVFVISIQNPRIVDGCPRIPFLQLRNHCLSIGHLGCGCPEIPLYALHNPYKESLENVEWIFML